MGFSVDGGGQWLQSFNWKPSTQSQKIGAFKESPLVTDFVTNYGKTKESNLRDYSNTQNYITNMRWKTPFTDGAVQLGDIGGAFNVKNNPNAKYNIFGGKGEDSITGGHKNDLIQGGGGNDRLSGMGGNDELWGGAGDDTINGGEGRDVLYGNDGNDTLNGDAGDDLLLGDKGNDKLNGGAGNDFLVGGAGNDIMTGGTGADRFYLSALSGSGTKITDFKAADGDNIHIIGKTGSKGDYRFEQRDANVLIKDKSGNLMATVENAKKDDVKAKTVVGPSRFEGYDDTSIEKEVSKNPPSRIKIEGLDKISDLERSSTPTNTFKLNGNVTTEIDGFAYSAGHRLKLGAGVDAKDVTATITRNKVTVKDGDRELAILTPPTGTRDLGTWMQNVQKALREIGVTANLPK